MRLLTAGEGEEEAEEDGEPPVLQFVQLVLLVQHLLVRPEVCVLPIAPIRVHAIAAFQRRW